MISKEQFARAMAVAIARDDIVVKVAKIIAPAAFASPAGMPGRTSTPEDILEFSQAKALEIAREVLAAAAQMNTGELRRQLAEAEIAYWLALGLPGGTKEALGERVRQKYNVDVE